MRGRPPDGQLVGGLFLRKGRGCQLGHAGWSAGACVSGGCHNLVPQTEGLKRADIYFLTAWEVRSSKPRCCQGRFLPEALSKKPSPALPASGSCWNPCCSLAVGPFLQPCFCLHTNFSVLLCVPFCLLCRTLSLMYHRSPPQVSVLPP